MANVLDLQRSEDPRDHVHRAVQSLAEGHVVCVPTETVYSLCANALDAQAVGKLMTALGDSGLKPSLSVKSADEALDFLCDASTLSRRLARQCWPGPVTLVTRCHHPDSAIIRLPKEVRGQLLGDNCEVGLRVVKHAAVQSLLHYWCGPLVMVGLTNENREPQTTSPAANRFDRNVAIILDDGPTRYGGRCTSVRVDGSRFKILDHGVVEDDVIRQFAQPLILLVCTGNTCRSPMAEKLLVHRLTDNVNGSGKRLRARVASAGLAAMDGDCASPQAVEVLRRRGIDLSEHQSRCADQSLLLSADLILTMTNNHAQAILRSLPQLQIACVRCGTMAVMSSIRSAAPWKSMKLALNRSIAS